MIASIVWQFCGGSSFAKMHKPRRGGWGTEVRTDQGPRQSVPAVIAACWTIEAYVGKVCEGLKRFLHLHAVTQPTSRRDDGHIKERIQYIPTH